jgi:hypothetical protein
MVAKARSLRKKEISSLQGETANYNDLKEIVILARRNGWDLESLGLIPKDLHTAQPTPLTKKQKLERDRLVRSIFKRFSRVLTPPVPSDLEQSILKRDQANWLPWEREVIERITSWRHEMSKAKPQILAELNSVLSRTHTAA